MQIFGQNKVGIVANIVLDWFENAQKEHPEDPDVDVASVLLVLQLKRKNPNNPEDYEQRVCVFNDDEIAHIECLGLLEAAKLQIFEEDLAARRFGE